MDATKLRAWWWRRQGLDGSLEGRPASEILARTGWARSVGGAGPYLALFARGRIRRPAVDAALERMEIQELPAARGCTYVVPAQDCALALVAGQGFDTEMATARKLGVTDREIEQLCSAVLKALLKGSLEPEELKQAAGGAARSLGPEGVKKGLAGTMPLALGRLQAEGEIRRIPANGRLDQQRYRYALWRPGPFHRARPSPAEARVELARRFFSWTGPARLSEFQWFSGFGARVVRASVEPLDLVSVGGDLLLLPEDREEFVGFQAPGEPRYRLVGSLDGIAHLRRDLASLLEPADADRQVISGKAGAALGGLSDLPSHGIFDRGRLVGLWEYDVSTQTVAWASFAPAGEALRQEAAATEEFVRADLGDARSFSLDSPRSREPRVAALRAARD